MQDIKGFSINDFLAFFFPGVISLIGIYLLLLLTPLHAEILAIPLDFSTSVFMFVFSYVLGAFCSKLLPNIEETIYDSLIKKPDPRSTLSLFPLKNDLLIAFKSVFLTDDPEVYFKTNMGFYYCRAAIRLKFDRVSYDAEWQNNLQQMRRNLIIPVFILMSAGILWGNYFINYSPKNWGIALLVVSTVFGLYIILYSIPRAMYASRKREARIIFTSFIAAYKMDLLNEYKSKNNRSKKTKGDSRNSPL
jgi:hypothetical protein